MLFWTLDIMMHGGRLYIGATLSRNLSYSCTVKGIVMPTQGLVAEEGGIFLGDAKNPCLVYALCSINLHAAAILKTNGLKHGIPENATLSLQCIKSPELESSLLRFFVDVRLLTIRLLQGLS